MVARPRRVRRVSRSVALIGAPTSAGAYAPGQEDAPGAVRDAGLAEQLRRHGVTVVDHGDIPRWRWRPDRESPRAMNPRPVADAIRAVAEKVARAIGEGHLPLVVGGDCTIELGTVTGALTHVDAPRLLYFDAHPDMNVPDAVTDGSLDWMGVAHLLALDGALPALAGLGDRQPLLDPSDVVLFANDPRRSTAHERRTIAELGIEHVPQERVLADPLAAADDAVAAVTRDGAAYLVHFDTDVIDFGDLPLAENTDKNVGLSFATAMDCLEELLAGDRLAAVTVTELNPHHGEPDGATVREFVGGLARSLGHALAR